MACVTCHEEATLGNVSIREEDVAAELLGQSSKRDAAKLLAFQRRITEEILTLTHVTGERSDGELLH